MSDINIEGLDRAEILAALYNNSRQQGFGFMHSQGRATMTKADAVELLKTETYFDYLRGRVMKVSLPEGAKTLRPYAYDRDNGQGAAEQAINSIRPVPRGFDNKFAHVLGMLAARMLRDSVQREDGELNMTRTDDWIELSGNVQIMLIPDDFKTPNLLVQELVMHMCPEVKELLAVVNALGRDSNLKDYTDLLSEDAIEKLLAKFTHKQIDVTMAKTD